MIQSLGFASYIYCKFNLDNSNPRYFEIPLTGSDICFPSGTFLCNFTLDNSKSTFNNQLLTLKSGIENISKIIDNNRMAAKC